MVAQPAELTLQVGPVSARVSKAGQGDPLVYLHGAFGFQGWPPFLDRLAERFTVYAPLHPGFGEADDIESIDDTLELALYHFDLLDALGLTSAHLVGHFFGAMIAAEVSALCPHRVDRLVLASPGGLWLDDNPGVDYFATPPSDLRGILFGDPDSEVAKRTMPESGSNEERAQQIFERARSLSTVGKFLWPIPDKGLRKRLHRIKAPTLIVVADKDRIVPPVYGDEVASRVPDSRLHAFRDAGHLFMLERPDEFSEVVSEFLSE